jgi:cyclopropane fatty-acyl-phospholipid synthase-like methyltransferase
MVTKKKPTALKLDMGCGPNKKEGFHGVDQYKMPGVDTVLKIGTAKWPWANDSVDELHASHFLEHLTQDERVHFFNEAHRVMKKGSKATIITPHWANNRAYGDPTHKWPAISEMFYFYLSKKWRAEQAQHTDVKWNPKGYSCDFAATWGHSFTAELSVKNQEYVQYALQNFKDAAQDLHATLTKE